jgi:hypothetical protein
MNRHKDSEPDKSVQDKDAIPSAGTIISPQPIALQGDTPPAELPKEPETAKESSKAAENESDQNLPPVIEQPPKTEISGQESISEAQSVVAAQVEAAAKNLESQAASPATTNDAVTPNEPGSIGTAIDLEAGTPPETTSSQFEPADPYTPDPYHPKKKPKRNNKRMFIGVAIIGFVLLTCIGVGAYSVWYVKSNVLSSVKYSNYQTVSVKGTNGKGGFIIDVPAEYSQDNKTEDSIEYSHRVPADKGSGNYSGIAINMSAVADDQQLTEISTLKEVLKNKDSEASKQFVSLINGSLSGQQTVVLDGFIEKTNTKGQSFFGYDINLQQDATNVGRGWMLIATTKKYIYVVVLYGTVKTWNENPNAWQYMFNSLQIDTNN